MLCLLATVLSRAQAEQLPIRTYTTADGLVRDQINRIVQDSHGFLWFCTAEGLSRYDGYKFTNYTTDQGLPHRVVNDLLETRRGIYWVATGDGLCRFNPTGNQLRTADSGLRVSASTNPQSEIRNARSKEPRFVVHHPSEDEKAQSVNVLFEDREGAIWCGTNGGLYRVEQSGDQSTFHFVDIGMPSQTWGDTAVIAITQDRQGALWVGTGSGLYRRRADGRTERYTTEHGLPANEVRTLLEDREGQLWVGANHGLCRVVSEPDLNRPAVARVYTMKDGLPSNWISSSFQSSDGRLWIGTAGGLSEFIPTVNKGGQVFRSYTATHGLTSLLIMALAEDRDGNLWMGTDTSGAMKMALSGFTTYSEVDGLGGARVFSIFENQAGELCVISTTRSGATAASGKFINRFDGTRFNAVKPNLPKPLTDFGWGWNQITFQDREGEWWVPTGQGLYRFPKVGRVEQLAHTHPKAVYTTRDGLIGDEIFRLFEDSRGDIWIVNFMPGQGGLTRWERTTETFHSYSDEDGLPSSKRYSPAAFCEDASGSLWLGITESGGLARYRAGRFTVFTAADGVPMGSLRALYLDQGRRLWIASSLGGLSRIDDPLVDHPQFVSYTTAQGLSSNDVSCITEDQWGRIYAGTGRGLDRLDPATGYIKHYTSADGLSRGNVEEAFRDRQGALWFGTFQGISRLIPEPDRPTSPPPVLISGLRIAGETYSISELGEAEVSKVELGPNQNQIEIDFFGIGFGLGEALRYQYMLEGANRDWSAASDQRAINYANLSSGTYRFLVRAVSADGSVSTTPASFAFAILPPIWQRWWFVTLAALLIGLTVYAIYRYRVVRLLELERVRTRIATDLHDDIGAGLSRIAVLTEVADHRAREGDLRVTEPLATIAAASRELVDSMSDIVWAINPNRDQLRDLTQRMRRFAGDIFAARDIELIFHAPGAEQDLRIGADVRRQVFLIFKESVNNIARHSGCTKAEIELAIEGGWLALKLSDNGKGFDPVRVCEGNGLTNMRVRAEQLGGQLHINSRCGTGTTVTLKTPLAATIKPTRNGRAR